MSNETNGRVAEFFVIRTAELANKQGVQINATLYEDESKDVREAKVKELNRLVDRMRNEYELPMLEAKYEQMKMQLSMQMDAFEGLQAKERRYKADTRKNNKDALNAQEIQQISAFPTHLEKVKKELSKGLAEINRVRETLGMLPFEEVSS